MSQPQSQLDLGHPFFDDYYFSHFRSLCFLSQTLQGSASQALDPSIGPVEVLDISRTGIEINSEWTQTTSFLTFEKLREEVHPDCRTRIMHVSPQKHKFSIDVIYRFLSHWNHYDLRDIAEFNRRFDIPSQFWDDEGNGSVGQRRITSENNVRKTNIWMRIMLKAAAGDDQTTGFQQISVFLQKLDDVSQTQHGPSAIMICLNLPRGFRERIHRVMDTTAPSSSRYLNEVHLDPFRLLLPVLMGWYSWSSELFWKLRDHMLALEIANGSLEVSKTPQYAYMHLVSKDMIQAIELLKVGVKTVTSLLRIYSKLASTCNDATKSELMEETISAFEYHSLRFESVLSRTQALLKRMDNQINLSFNLVQQQDAKVSQRNSDSVATISILTLMFLPATAIATIFATPFFVPSKSERALTILPSFVYYWALTLPVTIVIMCIWHWWGPQSSPSNLLGQIQWPWKQREQLSASQDLELPRMESGLTARPRSPHFWQFEPKWPMPQDTYTWREPAPFRRVLMVQGER